ncbi:YeeE/YedE family protein [Bizionia gelidisalsuginis]|uniref:YeeE/YedE family protein n=2 Tax=Bizionia TaxID=283785 RepID=A0A8H2QJZ9_9FLAO|nr:MULTISPECIES: YeeE/YedE thiosulfate transporter family protein [Bizionia]TYB77279.1 YeeE/YedE family protein [Bizionia saleffrena]TYC18053.1 YeeE/YedE family protein [Bizionia gelidisalsuginis]
MEYLYSAWPWYVSGPLIAGAMVLLILMGKKFGMSSNLRTLCSIGGAGRLVEFFRFDWKKDQWNLWVVVGVIAGGFVALQLSPNAPQINEDIVIQLQELGINSTNSSFLPTELFSLDALLTIKGFLILLIAGFLVGFGARYAGGCTSGHAISGLSNLQVPSLIAVVGFFIGGLVMVHLLFPLIF